MKATCEMATGGGVPDPNKPDGVVKKPAPAPTKVPEKKKK